MWGLIAVLSAGTVVAAAMDETGRTRIAQLYAPGDVVLAGDLVTRDDVADLTEELTRLRSETRLLALEREAMAIKIAQLETEMGPITGSIPDTMAAQEMPLSDPGIRVIVPSVSSEPDDLDAETATTETGVTADDVALDDSHGLDTVVATAADSAAPKTVRTIDVGFVPLPKSRQKAIDSDSQSDTAASGTKTIDRIETGSVPPAEEIEDSSGRASIDELSALAHPVARIVPSKVGQTQFAVQIGMADSMPDVRELWMTLSNAHDILLGRLDPQVAIAESEDSIRLRLLAGPFADAADAIQLCTLLIDRGVDCRAVRSEGQTLVMR